MRIQNSNSYKQTFGAYHIANATNIISGNTSKLKIYKLTENDKPFLEQLRKSVNLQNLMPEMKKSYLDVWQTIFNIAVQQASEKNKTGILAVYDNIPCGIMAFSQKQTAHKLNTICTWPTQPEKRVPFAGKTLMRILFDDFLKSNSQKIELDAVTYSPFSPVIKYSQLGFRQTGGENGITSMRTNRSDVENTIKKISNFIKIIPVDKISGEVNLMNLL